MSFTIKEFGEDIRVLSTTFKKRGERDFHFLKFCFQTGKFTEDVVSFRFFAITLSTINLAFAKPLTANNVENYFKKLSREFRANLL
jgi:hypothetical protein